MFKVVVDRAQAEIDAGFRRKTLRRNGERIERGQHQRFRFGVQRQNTPLLDQRAGQGLDENTLRQRQLVRLAAAFVAGLVSCGQCHDHLGAGPRMFGKIVRGLRGAGTGTRLWQGERIVGRGKQRVARLAGCLLVLEREGRLCVRQRRNRRPSCSRAAARRAPGALGP